MAGKIEGLQLLGPGKLIDPADAFGLAHGLDAVQLAPAQEVRAQRHPLERSNCRCCRCFLAVICCGDAIHT